jgi:mRNA interferase RelE/StbE
MGYRLFYTQRTARDISKLQNDAKGRIKKSLERYAEDPLLYSKKMVDSTLGTYRFRVGDYRIVFDIEDDELIILRVGKRDEIYRNLGFKKNRRPLVRSARDMTSAERRRYEQT